MNLLKRALLALATCLPVLLTVLISTPSRATCPPSFTITTIGPDADCIFRDYSTDGIPTSGPYNPQKSQIRQWGETISSALASGGFTPFTIGSGLTLSGGTLSLGDATLTYATGNFQLGNGAVSTGLSLNSYNGNISGGVNTDNDTLRSTCIVTAFGNAKLTPGFSDANCAEINITTQNMDATYAGTTHNKTTVDALNMSGYYLGAGQKILQADTINCFGMSDCADKTIQIHFASGPIPGDEGQGFELVDLLSQQTFLSLSHITSIPTQSTCTTTVTQQLNQAAAIQTFIIGGITGACNVGDWVVLNQAPADDTNSETPMQITATGSGTLSGQVRGTYPSGTTITPATVIVLDSTFQTGQNRVMVDLSRTPYKTGTVSSITGGGFTGSGTSWADNMVGGNVNNIGCINLLADTYADTPYNGTASGSQGPLNSYYRIKSVASNTSLAIYTTSAAGDASYHGKGPGTFATATVTISNASPAVVTWTTHGLAINQAVVFSTTGALPTGLTAGTTYYVAPAGFTTNSFEVVLQIGGAVINTSSAGSGTQTASTLTGTYTIRPCARILYENGFVPGASPQGLAVLESSSTTWTVGDTIETAINPYPDVQGFQYHMVGFTPGGAWRGFMDIENTGPVQFGFGINISTQGQTGGWGTGISIDHAAIGLSIGSFNTGAAIQLNQGGASGGMISWGNATGGSPSFRFNATNGGMDIAMLTFTGISGDGLLQGILTGTGAQGQAALKWNGFLAPVSFNFSVYPACSSTWDGAIAAMLVSNASPAFGDNITSNGTTHVIAHCNGTNWTVMGK